MGKKNKAKITLMTLVAIIVIGVAGFFMWKSGPSNNGLTAYVDSVSMITDLGSGTGLINRYSGVVEPQETIEINRNQERQVKELFVKIGDKVEEGTELFAYDTDEMSLSLSQAELELERLGASITSLNEQIKLLKSQKSTAPEDQKLDYTSQILNTENDLKRAEYDKKSKEVEVAQLKASLENSVVKSTVSGVVKSISENGYDMYGQNEAYITLLSTKDYRIKGKVSEQNIWQLQAEQPVIIRSRVDETQTWSGMITHVDLENTESNNNNNYYGSTGESGSTYPFYIELASASGLILGQHVYIELDNGQDEVKEGVWLYDYYLVHEADGDYVWVATENDKLEKRKVTLGELDEEWMRYEILDGLTVDDYIAFPDDRLIEGMSCERMLGSGGYLLMEESDFEEGFGGDFKEDFNEGFEGEFKEDFNEEVEGEFDEGIESEIIEETENTTISPSSAKSQSISKQ
ncbi:efflux RND transporter periplasmic adaptor subunit [Turicibacter bilis]|uniref:efflux RND transporter periplasmic adaptor subunit n=1 Tax=Turicibacter bilis TaxID=2735723 RepID=UPI001BAEB16D|nr:efflux RND transporter periplasmic adaptor subunit [Turicibacter bilis]MBS3203452.1 efflux RND transporter periplasmic adaptor subunit [Turicibacter bilis]UUF10735.1 efflux RND transporter periplasmic adaptor subunit [Turicibacter bilis]